MQFDSLTLHAMICQLKAAVAPGRRVIRVFQTSRLQTIVELSGNPPSQMVLSCCPQSGRIHFDDGWAPDPSVNYPLGGVLRRWLRSAVLVDVAQRGFDRAVRLEFVNARALGPQSRFYLILEIMGRHSNLIAVDEAGVVLEAVKHVTAQVNRYRQIIPGLQYTPPPDFGKQHPGHVTAHQLVQSTVGIQGTVALWFRNTLQGASDLFRDEALARANIPPDMPTAEMTHEDLQQLQHSLRQLLQQACTESRGWVYQGPQTAFVYPVVLQSLTGFDRACYPDLSSAAAHVAHLDLSTSTLEQDRRRLLEAVRRAQATIEKRVAERTEGHQRAQDAESIRRQAETLLTYVHLVPQGAAAVELTDPHNHDDTLSIHLDPRLSAQQNAQKLFARYKKLVAMQRRIETLLQAARREQHYLAGLLDQVQQADNAEQMTDLEAEIIQQGYIKQARQPIRHKAPKLQVHSAEVMGYTIMWGTSGLQNDKLLRLATPEDIWLHTRKTPGGHVLIRTNGQPDHIPDEVVVAAAAHAARLSKRRTDTRVAVDYALIKHVRRLKGTPPGYVHYTTHKTVHVDPANGLELFNR